MRVEVASELSMIPNNVCIDIQSEGIRIKASVAIKAKDVPMFETFHKKDGANIDRISTVLPMGFRLVNRICKNRNIRYYLTYTNYVNWNKLSQDPGLYLHIRATLKSLYELKEFVINHNK
ncbi:MAG: hypothetical protein SO067_04735 [Bacilli bacterium]|nr:hypothetical protein [Bacilli bacterium]